MAATCPSPDRLQRLALGILDEAEIKSLGAHLLSCSRCADTIAEFKTSDTLVEALRAVSSTADALAVGSMLQSAIDRACQLSDARFEAGSKDTSANASELSRAVAAPTGQQPEPTLNFADMLGPPQSPGELGRLGPYRILKFLDSGGMGTVFLAEDTQLQRPVALKAMQPALATSQEGRRRFLREARAAAALRHDNIVTIYHVGEDRGTLWLAMELLEGESLRTRLDRCAKLEVVDCVQIGRQIAAALAAAHSRGLIHRDIKPANVWLQSSEGNSARSGAIGKAVHGVPRTEIESAPAISERRKSRSVQEGMPPRIKLLDFGLARIGTDDAQLTRSGLLVGTPAYMSPEQGRGETVDHRCDLFSLGCVLYRMLTGISPFGGKDTMAILTALATEAPPAIRKLRPEVPPALDDLISKLLTKDPDLRPQSAAEVAQSLADIESSLPLVSRSRPLSLSRSLIARSALRNPRAALIAAAAAALLVVLGVVVSVRTPQGEVVVELGPGVKADDVKIEVKKDQEIKIADAEHGWTIDVREGAYNVQLAGNTDRFDIDRNKITVSRNKKTHLIVTLKPAVLATSSSSSNPKSAPSGFALEFNGRDSYVDLPTLRYDGSHPITLEATIMPFQAVAQGVVVGDRGDEVGASGVSLKFPIHDWAETSKLGAFVVGNGVRYLGSNSRDSITPGRQIQVAGIRDGSTIRLFIDGRLQSTRVIDSYHQRKGPFNIGVSMPGEGSAAMSFTGLIDELRVSRVARYAADYTPLPRLEVDEHTLALYHFDEGQGDVLTDSSGNGHHGKIVNARWVNGIAAGPRSLAAPVARAAKPFYENDFSRSENWIRQADEGKPLICRDGMFIIEIQGKGYRWHGYVPWLDTADIEIVGRATNGSWGFSVFGTELPGFGIAVHVGPQGSVSAKRVVRMSPGRSALTPLNVHSPVAPVWNGDAAFNVLRAVVKDRKVTVFLNGEPACDPIELPDPLPLMGIVLSGFSGNEEGLQCEFDSIRVWRAGEGPPLPTAGGPSTAATAGSTSSAPPLAASPFTSDQAKAHQEAWAAHLGAPVEQTNSIGIKLRLIPPGEFMMGSTQEQINAALRMIAARRSTAGLSEIQSEAPQHRVTIPQPLLIAATEVTSRQFRKFVESAGYLTETEKLGSGRRYAPGEGPENDRDWVADATLRWNSPNYTMHDDLPVTVVTWNDAVAFCNWLSATEKLTPCYRHDVMDDCVLMKGADGYRLPTEAEWEYACRAGATTQYSCGDDGTHIEQHSWLDRKEKKSAPQAVGLKLPNNFGLFDMHGNVWEWCHDWWSPTWYANAATSLAGPPFGSYRVKRGGGWYSSNIHARSAYRHPVNPVIAYNALGFRVVRSPVAPPPNAQIQD